MTETATQSDPGRGTVVLYNPVAPYFQMPLGILAVGTALQRAGFEVRLVDGRVNRPGDRELTRLLDGAVMAGVGVLSGKPILDAIRFSRQVKELAPDLPVVWGGWHPSLLPEQCLTEGSVDYVIRGPGEESAAALASCLARGAETGEVPGLTRRTASGSIVSSDVLLPAEPPALDYRLLTMDHYWAPRGSRTLDYITSQGCPFNCAFCSDPAVYHHRWRAFPPERVIEELGELVARYDIERVAFLDDMFFLKPQRARAIAEGLLGLRRPLRWSATFRAGQLAEMDEDLMILMVRSGLDQMVVGAESGSDRLLASIDKRLTADQILKSARLLHRFGVKPAYGFITGLPGETPEDRRATEEMVFRIGEIHPHAFTRIFFYTPYPGSRLTSEMGEDGAALPASLEEWGNCDFFSADRTGTLDREEIKRVSRINFYTHYASLPPPRKLLLRPLAALSRWRRKTRRLGFPWEKALLSWRPGPAE